MSELLKCEKLCKSFGGLAAVDKVDFTVQENEIVGVIGPNGAGKTTFFNTCSGVYAPTSGEVWLQGVNISSAPPDKVAALGMARTFQNIQLFRDMSTLENVKLGFHIQLKTNLLDALLHTKRYHADEKFSSEMGMEMLRKVGIEEYAAMNAGNLPYGTQRKLEIARALALNPKILLLDEPAAGMNPKETTALLELIQRLNQEGLSIVVIEHDMKFVMSLCQKVVVINFGRKICEGTPLEVTSDPEVKKAYLGERKVAQARAVRQKC